MNTYDLEIVNCTGTLDDIETKLNDINGSFTHFAVGYNSSSEEYVAVFFSVIGYYNVKVVSDKGSTLQGIPIVMDNDTSYPETTNKHGLAVLTAPIGIHSI